VDLACTEAGTVLNGPALLDYTVNGRPLRRPGSPNSNRSQFPAMAPHGIYPSEGEDRWVALACRNDAEWQCLAGEIGGWAGDSKYATLAGRLAHEDALDQGITDWTSGQHNFTLAARLQSLGLPATAVQLPEERIDHDPNTSAWGLWPTVKHSYMGDVRVDGMPVHFSRTDWEISRGAGCLGEHNDYVFGEILGYSSTDIATFRSEGVI
jgi:crotonobetainyl-CoA:carnitine CoA-transferase CaiB-like acyl-CoA transferase